MIKYNITLDRTLKKLIIYTIFRISCNVMKVKISQLRTVFTYLKESNVYFVFNVKFGFCTFEFLSKIIF